jgi:tellurite resistance protein TerC
MPEKVLLWTVFNLFIIAMLVLDLKVFHRKTHEVHIREALVWSAIWILMALIFAAGIYVWMDTHKALQFLTGYLIEKSLSMDNLFVFLMIFSYFQVPSRYQHNVLFWGIFGALVMRAIFIFTGIAIIQKFHFVMYIFGAFLIFTGIKMGLRKDRKVHPEKNPMLKFVRRFVPITGGYEKEKFLVREKGRMFVTPLMIVLIAIETTDVIFAVDSIPAILAISTDPFIVYSSNVFAILGLRALYFALESAMRLFHHLHYGLAVILVFVGVKMLLAEVYKIPVGIALLVIFASIFFSIVASLMLTQETLQSNTKKK